ncbi:hypothetical protein Zmor_000067 [Zophobas morio]|uniref:Uncharacterized protein n=1 Tax=Zophobas morio TaxID=2755281 RepID=A0AA38MQU5_9CUCU|nr:hypothetical protein Zmor_000067 [Zophobas morio]
MEAEYDNVSVWLIRSRMFQSYNPCAIRFRVSFKNRCEKWTINKGGANVRPTMLKGIYGKLWVNLVPKWAPGGKITPTIPAGCDYFLRYHAIFQVRTLDLNYMGANSCSKRGFINS